MINYQLIGFNIKTARTKANLTQEILAEKLDISVEYLSKIENARSKLSLTLLDKISETLKLDPIVMMGGLNSEFNKLHCIPYEFIELLNEMSPDQASVILDVCMELARNISKYDILPK